MPSPLTNLVLSTPRHLERARELWPSWAATTNGCRLGNSIIVEEHWLSHFADCNIPRISGDPPSFPKWWEVTPSPLP
jgi:hypothetical protein